MTEKQRMTTGGTAFGYPVSSLRTEARKGNLALIRVAGKDWVEAAAIREMERKCRSVAKAPACTSGTSKDMRQHMSSSTGPDKSVQDAALASFNRLKKSWANTSRKTTGPTPGNVISLKSRART